MEESQLMPRLTYSDRQALLKGLDDAKADWQGSDADLSKQVLEWATRLVPTFGYENVLIRDATILSGYLRTSESSKITEIAKGALVSIVRAEEESDPRRSQQLRLVGEAYVCSMAVYEIRKSLGESATYAPPQLSDSEKNSAEELFLKFVEEIPDDNFDLNRIVENKIDLWGGLRGSGLFNRLRQDTAFLQDIYGDQDRTDEHRRYAQAALRYLVCEADAIDDRLGLVGLIDDWFIARWAVELIDPNRNPWIDLLDATVSAWPFTEKFLLDDGAGPRLLSEYALVTAALTSVDVRVEGQNSGTLVVVPVVGPTPFLLGVISAFGLVEGSGNEPQFWVGQKVLIDGDSRKVAKFWGIEPDGQSFKLVQYSMEKGQKLKTTHFWPIDQLSRLVPADKTKKVQGKLTGNSADVPVSAVEFLFGHGERHMVDAVEKQVVVVSATTPAKQLAEHVELHGWALRDAIPMGHLNANTGYIESWSSRFGGLDPILVFVSDLDRAEELIEDDPSRFACVVIDATARNASKHASVNRLKALEVPSVFVTDEWTAKEMDTTGMAVWEWTKADFNELMWPVDGPDPEMDLHTETRIGIIARHEQRLRSDVFEEPVVETVSLPEVTAAFDAHRQIKQLARQRGDDRIDELDDLVSVGFWIFSQLLKCATPVDDQLPSMSRYRENLARFDELKSGSSFLSEAELAALDGFRDRILELVTALVSGNPKAHRVEEILARQGGVLICPNYLFADLERTYAHRDVHVSRGNEPGLECPGGAVIPGWFGKQMPGLLMPPVATPLTLVLHDLEAKWYQGLDGRRVRESHRRRQNSSRGKIFAQFDGWEVRDAIQSIVPGSEEALDELEEIDEHLFDAFKKRVSRTYRPGETEEFVSSRLVFFSGGGYGMFSDAYRLNVVTHLIGNVSDSTKKEPVVRTTVDELQIGDAIVFRQSDKDIIREEADKFLSPGVREKAAAWRRAILRFMEQNDFTTEQIYGQLRDEGCRVQQQTVGMWIRDDQMIAPQSYRRDVSAIADATGDDELTGDLAGVLTAIADVRSAHLSASFTLAEQVRTLAAEVVHRGGADLETLRLHDGFVIVRVEHVARDKQQVSFSVVNRLVEDDSWLG